MATEKRLIDANAIEYPPYFYEDEAHPDPFIEGYRQGKIDAINDVRALAPTVDAVEVVRCEKCVHSVNDEEEPGMCKCVVSAEYESESGLWLGFIEYHTPDFFCAFGERKDND